MGAARKLKDLSDLSTALAPKGLPVATYEMLDEWLARGETEVFSVGLLMTPEIAHRLLERNPGNRPLRIRGANRSVQAYTQAMQRDEWEMNGEHIVMSREGLLNDGQHRLKAVAESGKTVPMQITFGVSRASRQTVDQGSGRTPGDILSLAGERNTNQLSGALQFVWAYENQINFRSRPSPQQLLDTLTKHPQVRDAVRETHSLNQQYRVSHGYMAAAYYLTALIDSDKAAEFLHAANTGFGLASNDSPVWRLRKRFQDHLAKREILPNVEQAALYIKAFNAYRQGRNLRYLAWRRYGEGAEDFPQAGEELRVQGGAA